MRRCVSTPAVWEGWAARSIPPGGVVKGWEGATACASGGLHDCVALEEGSGAGAVLAPRSEEEEVAATVACWALQRAGAGEGRGTLCGLGAVAVGRPSYALFGNRPGDRCVDVDEKEAVRLKM